MTNCAKRTGFTLPEFLLALLCVAILLVLFVSVFSRGLVTPREAARRTKCLNNLRNLALAAISYESSHQEFPIGVGIEDQNGVLQTNPVSGLVALLPFLEQSKFYDEISNPLVVGEMEYPAFEAPLTDADYPPWAEGNSVYLSAHLRSPRQVNLVELLTRFQWAMLLEMLANKRCCVVHLVISKRLIHTT